MGKGGGFVRRYSDGQSDSAIRREAFATRKHSAARWEPRAAPEKPPNVDRAQPRLFAVVSEAASELGLTRQSPCGAWNGSTSALNDAE